MNIVNNTFFGLYGSAVFTHMHNMQYYNLVYCGLLKLRVKVKPKRDWMPEVHIIIVFIATSLYGHIFCQWIQWVLYIIFPEL